MQPLSGVYNILSTPFTPSGALDVDSLKRLTHATIETGVDGITVLGVDGEAQKLNSEERETVIQTVRTITADQIPVIEGTSHDGTDLIIETSRRTAGWCVPAGRVAAGIIGHNDRVRLPGGPGAHLASLVGSAQPASIMEPCHCSYSRGNQS